ELHVDAMCAEVALLGGVIFGVDEDRVIRAGRHAGFAAYTDGLVKIDDAVRPFEHRRRRARGYTGSVSALIAARHLMRASYLWKHADVNVFDVGACDRKRD
ncbi:MAG TPA: hypothetical protein VKA78_17620, partial [Pyrinomonadaceae bacterium]|nr:hypothetical protein [Pyrinomonadaceae bacterium]